MGVIRKFGDDRGGSLSGLLAFYGFVSLFPLLLVMVTILGFFHPAEHSLLQRTESAALSQFPIVGTKLSQNIHALHGRSTLGLVVGIAGVLWGSQGALQTAQYAQAEVWNVPGEARPNFWARLGRTAAMTALLGVFLLASTVVAGVVTIGHHGLAAVAGAFIVSLALNVCLFAVAFRVLTPRQSTGETCSPDLSSAASAGRSFSTSGACSLSIRCGTQGRNTAPSRSCLA